MTLHTISFVRVWDYAWDWMWPLTPLPYVIIKFVVVVVSHNHTHPAHMHDHTRQLMENNKIQGSKGGRVILLTAVRSQESAS